MMKKIRSGLLPLLLLLCLMFPQTVSAAGTSIIDDADLFTTSDEDELAKQMADLAEKTGMDYLVITTDNAQGKSAQDYADTAYKASGAGSDALLYLIDMDNREIYVYTQGEMIRYLTDDRIDSILDAAYEEIADGDYYDSAFSVLWNTDFYYDEGIPDGQYNYDEVNGEIDDYKEEGGFPILALSFGMIAGGIAALITFFRVKGSYNLTYETYHYPLSEKGSLDLKVSEDLLTGTFVTHRRIPKSPPPSSSSGRSSSGRSTVHRAGSGRSHGGGGRSF